MKNTLIAIFFIVITVSCKKENISTNSATSISTDLIKEKTFFNGAYSYLKENVTENDFKKIDFKKIIITNFNTGYYIIRIQLKGDIYNRFILMKADSVGNCSEGKILTVMKKMGSEGSDNYVPFTGKIIVTTLTKTIISAYKIKDGFSITNDKYGLSEEPTLPDVVVTAYIPNNSFSVSYSDWFNLLDFYSEEELGLTQFQTVNGSGITYGYYTATDPTESEYTDNTQIEDSKRIEFIDPLAKQGIAINDYLKCFDNIPDNGSSCSIEIFTDIPVNDDPNAFFDWHLGSPGHTFLRLKKTNGNSSVEQNFGFYPNEGWKTMFFSPVAGKFVDDGGHEVNASLKMPLSSEQFHSVINEIKSLASYVKYDIDEYNCTDFALQVFNFVRPGNEINIPLYIIPGEMQGIESKTPQGLYQKLRDMKNAEVDEAKNITIPGISGFVGQSKGPCK